MSINTDRNLLIGIMALQMELIGRDDLLAAMHRWIAEKDRPLSRILIDAGVLDDEAATALERLADQRIERHHGDVQESLASFASLESSLKEQLLHVDDRDVTQSIAAIPPSSWKEMLSTGEFTSEGRFSIVRLHAEGGLGEVYLADDRELHRPVALKQIKESFAHRPGSKSRFLMEAELTARLEHPSIVPVYGLGHSEGGRPYYAMKFIRGVSLRKRIEEFHWNVGQGIYTAKQHSLALRELLGHFVDVCQAVEYAHSRGVLHRDLKPANIMLGRYGETLVVDWGLAKAIGAPEEEGETEEPVVRPVTDSDSETVFGKPFGTLSYASPEQISGQLDEIGPASDVYSLGATLFVVLTGEPPFKGQPTQIIDAVKAGAFDRPRKLKAQIPLALEAICLKAMAHRPSNRYESPGALARDIDAWLADEPVEAMPDPILVRARRWVRRHQTLTAGFAAATLVALVGLVIGLSIVGSKNRQLEDAYLQLSDAKDTVEEERDRATDNYERSKRLSISLAIRRGQWEEALRIVDEAIAEGHDDTVGLKLERAQALYGVMDSQGCADQVAELYAMPDKGRYAALIELWQGDQLLLRHESENAMAYIDRAIESGLPDAELEYARSIRAETTLDAVEHLERAIEIDPFHQRAYHNLVATLIMLGRREEARRQIEVGRKLFPQDDNFVLMRGFANALEGNRDASMDDLEALSDRLTPAQLITAKKFFRNLASQVHLMDNWESGLNPFTLLNIVSMWGQFNSLTNAQALGQDNLTSLVIRPSGTAVRAYSDLVMLLSPQVLLSGQFRDNMVKLLLASGEIHQDGFLHFIRGVIHVTGGEAEPARDAFAEAVRHEALIPGVRRESYYALCMTEQMIYIETEDEQRLPAAVDALRERMKLGPMSDAHTGNVLNLCLRQREFELASELVSQKLSQIPGSPVWSLWMARIEIADEKLLNAIATVDAALASNPDDEQQQQLQKLRQDAVAQLKQRVDQLQSEDQDE